MKSEKRHWEVYPYPAGTREKMPESERRVFQSFVMQADLAYSRYRYKVVDYYLGLAHYVVDRWK